MRSGKSLCASPLSASPLSVMTQTEHGAKQAETDRLASVVCNCFNLLNKSGSGKRGKCAGRLWNETNPISVKTH